MFAVALVILGAVFLLKNLGILPSIQWDIIWPIALIVLGIAMMFNKRN